MVFLPVSSRLKSAFARNETQTSVRTLTNAWDCHFAVRSDRFANAKVIIAYSERLAKLDIASHCIFMPNALALFSAVFIMLALRFQYATSQHGASWFVTDYSVALYPFATQSTDVSLRLST